MKKLLSVLIALCLALSLAPGAFAEGDGWQAADGGWRYYENGAMLTGVRWIEAEGGRYIFDENGILQTGDAEGDVLFDNNLYYIHPDKNLNDPHSCFAVRMYTRNRGADVGITYYDGDGITFVGWISAGDGKLMYQTRIPKENVPGATKDIYIYVWRAQYIPEGIDPLTFEAIPAGWYLFDDNGVLVTQDGVYPCGDGHTYEVKDGNIVTMDGEPIAVPGAPSSKTYTIDNVPYPCAIEADVTMTGGGSGYQAKLVFVTPTSGITFGPQFDTGARAPYTNRNVLLVENILHNGAGGQDYQWPNAAGGGIDVPLGQPIHIMLGYDFNGDFSVYYNGELVGTYNNPKMVLPTQDLRNTMKVRVEVSAKHDGDSVNTLFSNIKIKNTDGPLKIWGNPYPLLSCPSITTELLDPLPLVGDADVTKQYNRTIRIYGTLSGIGGLDWDSAYDRVSGIMEFPVGF